MLDKITVKDLDLDASNLKEKESFDLIFSKDAARATRLLDEGISWGSEYLLRFRTWSVSCERASLGTASTVKTINSMRTGAYPPAFIRELYKEKGKLRLL